MKPARYARGVPYRSTSSRVAFDAAAVTDAGERPHDEDTFLVTDLGRRAAIEPPSGLGHLEGAGFVLGVYDGCGHGPNGFAGVFAARVVHERMCAGSVPRDAAALSHALGEAVAEAGRRLCRGKFGMGSTATVAALVNRSLVLAHVGDTRAYVRRDGRLIQLTRDHTLVADIEALRNTPEADVDSLTKQQRDLRALTAEQIADLPRNVVMRALGTIESVVPDMYGVELQSDDVLLLCTDGLYGRVDDAAILAMLGGHDPDATCRALVRAAFDAGAHDNLTALVARSESGWPDFTHR